MLKRKSNVNGNGYDSGRFYGSTGDSVSTCSTAMTDNQRYVLFFVEDSILCDNLERVALTFGVICV